MNQSNQTVTLIRTPPILPISSVTAQQGVPSLALAYLAAGLKQAGFQVNCIDALGENLGKFHQFGHEGLLAAGLTKEQIIGRISVDALLIGVSCQFSNDWIFAKQLLISLNQKFPRLPIICGGEHTTADYVTIFEECPFVRACILGEGEETLIELAHAIQSGSAIDSILGIAYRLESGEVRATLPRKRKVKIDEITWPDWGELPLRKYLDAGLGMAAQGLRSMPVLASRGCTYQCTFCSAPDMWASKWYGRKVDDVLAEVRHYIERYKIEHVEFYDMSPSLNKKWLTELVENLQGLNVSWNFPSGMRIENLSEELLLKMGQSGCIKVTFALETSAPHLIKQLKKNVNPTKLMSMVRVASNSGLITKVNFIWGLPNQTHFDLLRDYWYLFKLSIAGLHDATCFAFVPYPGSKDFIKLKAEGKIPVDREEYEKFLAYNVYNNPLKMRSWSIHIKDWELSFWTLGGMALFYGIQFLSRPWRAIILIERILNDRPLTMLELALYSLKNYFILGRKRKKNTGQKFDSPVEIGS